MCYRERGLCCGDRQPGQRSLTSGREQAAAYRKKDLESAAALIAAGLTEARTLHEQVDLLPVRDGDRKRLHYRVAAAAVEG